MKQTAVQFGPGEALVGVITEPEAAGDGRLPAFVFLNAGVTHRVGPSGLYVRLARALAEEGFASLRFDFSGIGDSWVRTDDLPPGEAVFAEVRDALDFLQRTRGIDTFVLIGICSGATIAYFTAVDDRRVTGLALINAQGHLHGIDPERGARLRKKTVTRHSWRIALRSSFRGKNWRKALQGKLDPRRVLGMMIGQPLAALFGRKQPAEALPGGPSPGGPRPPHDAVAELRGFAERGVRLLHLYCEGDEGLDYFHVVLGGDLGQVTAGDLVRYEIITGANHVFTLMWSQDRLIRSVRDWACTCKTPAQAPIREAGASSA